MKLPALDESSKERLIRAYERMLERVKSSLDHARQDTLPALNEQLEAAKEKAIELGEISREEAEKIGDYLRRDLHDAAGFLNATKRGLADWLRFDLILVEDRLIELFSTMVDQTRLELDRLAERAAQAHELHTGQITSPGTIHCTACRQELHFHGTAHIPPCPKCHGSVFERSSKKL